jgi:hypothetical protein
LPTAEEDVLVEEVPAPEPDWELTAAYQGGRRNPALQGSLWDYAAGGFRLVAGLSPPLEALAAQLRLDLERSWEDQLGDVDAAMFSIRQIHFALSHNDGSPSPDTKVWVSRNQTDVDAALDVLLNALGIGREALTYFLDPENDIFVELHADADGVTPP